MRSSDVHLKNPSWLAVFLFCVVLIGAPLTVYRWLKGPTIRADEVRLCRQLPSGKSAQPMLVHLRGDAAQDAASNFVFSTDGTIYECLDNAAWYHVAFLNSNEIRTQAHLSKSSRLCWEKLIQQRH